METLIRILLWGIIAVFALSCLLFIGLLFAGRGDWEYELTGGYKLIRLNASEIILGRNRPDSSSSKGVITEYYITDYCMNQRFIGIQGIRHKGLPSSYRGVEMGERGYFLINVSNGDVYGPYSKKEDYASKCVEVSTGGMGQWESTKDLGG